MYIVLDKQEEDKLRVIGTKNGNINLDAYNAGCDWIEIIHSDDTRSIIRKEYFVGIIN